VNRFDQARSGRKKKEGVINLFPSFAREERPKIETIRERWLIAVFLALHGGKWG